MGVSNTPWYSVWGGSCLEKQTGVSIPKSQQIFGGIVYWVTITSAVGALFAPVLILANPSNNVLNPNIVFMAIFEGQSPAEIWGYSVAGTFPGGHFYLNHMAQADSWAMIFIVIGCAFGLIGLIPAIIYQVAKEKDWFCAALGTVIAVLIFLSIIGILSIEG